MLCRYERTIFKSDKGFCIFAYSTSDESVPKEARNRSYYHDDKIHFTAIGYHLIATDAVEVELDGTWENSKHGLQLSVSMCKEVVPRDQAGILAYRDMIESFADTVDSTTIEERRRLLRTIVKKVVWDGKNVYVYLFAEDGELNLPPIGQLMCPSGEDSEPCDSGTRPAGA